MAIVFRYPLIHFHPTMSHILCCSECFISSRCYYISAVPDIYSHFVNPPPKKLEKKKKMCWELNSMATQVYMYAGEVPGATHTTHAIRIVCLIVWIFIYTSILYTATSIPADDNGDLKKREYLITPIRVFSEKDKNWRKIWKKKPQKLIFRLNNERK